MSGCGNTHELWGLVRRNRESFEELANVFAEGVQRLNEGETVPISRQALGLAVVTMRIVLDDERSRRAVSLVKGDET